MPPKRPLAERIWMNNAYARFGGNAGEVVRDWPYPTPRPSKGTVFKIARKFEITGSVQDIKPPGRPSSERTEENIDYVMSSIVDSSRKSISQISHETLISPTTVFRILKNDMNRKPYRPTRVCMLKDEDYPLRYPQIFKKSTRLTTYQ